MLLQADKANFIQLENIQQKRILNILPDVVAWDQVELLLSW
jgi:hypothetical protein